MSLIPLSRHHPFLLYPFSPPLPLQLQPELPNNVLNKNTHTVNHEYAAVTIQMFIND